MIMTGRYQLHYATTGGGGSGHTNGVPLNFTLLPEALASASYTSTFIGKWRKFSSRASNRFELLQVPLASEYWTH
jgi:arylsulfatase A-like enzyme